MNTDSSSETAEPATNKRKFRREIPVKLSDDETRAYGQQLARKEHEWTALDEKRKTVAAEYKTQLGGVSTEINRLTLAINSGEEMRAVECYEDVTATQVLIKRADTGEVVDQRPATFADHQVDMFDGLDTPSDVTAPGEWVPSNIDQPVVIVETSWTGDTVATMPDDADDGGETPVAPPEAVAPPPKKKRGRPARAKAEA